MSDVDFNSIEKKWQKKWLASGINKATKKTGKKFFMHFAYPGISGYLHVGHFRGFSYTDIITRFKRMQGFDVFFPVGTHASGNPAVAFSAKARKAEPDFIDYLKRNGCPPEKVKDLEDPSKAIAFFNNVYTEDWKNLGYLADWDSFACTTDPGYQKFIQWQFRELQGKGLLIQKPYYASFCPDDGPVSIDPSETDLSKGGNAEQNEYVLLKFKLGSDYLVAATLRPETIYGQTNLWVNPSIQYVRVQVGKENWVVSKEAGEKLAHQLDDVKELDLVKIEEFIGKTALAPGIDREIIILPARFCKAGVGTGIVTSVPSDAPYDYTALEELKKDEELLKKYSLDVLDLEPIPIITTLAFGERAALAVCEGRNITSLDDPKLEDATKEVYAEGYHKGVMNANCGKYKGLRVSEAKEKIKQELINSGKAAEMRDLSEEVLCRCGKKVFIKRVDDQWFINYGDKKLKEESKKHAATMNVYPEDYKKNIPSVIDWFEERPCTRLGRAWLGTKLPFDDKWTIEPIADSTLYPAYYVVARHLNTGKLKPEDLTDEFFDYAFLGKGTPKTPTWKTVRDDFEYWYPVDINLGGKEHQTVHFPVYVMNHVGIMNQKDWPKGIFVNYWVTGKAGKISKSKGGAEPIPQAIKKYGVDAMRLYYANVGSAHKDVVWEEEEVFRFKLQLEKIYSTATEETKAKPSSLDAWLDNSMNKILEKAYKAMESYDLRAYSEAVYFDAYSNLKWYLRRGGTNPSNYFKAWSKLMAPITPHLAEELWSKLAGTTLVSIEAMPETGTVNRELEQQEQNIQKILNDVAQVKKLAKVEKLNTVKLFIIPKDSFIRDAKEFLERELECPVEVIDVNKTDDPKAKKAKFGRPGISIQ